MDANFQPGDTVELLWELVVVSEAGNTFIYPPGTRFLWVGPGTEPDTSDLDDGSGNVFPNVRNLNFYKI